MSFILPPAKTQFFDDNGDPLVGGFVYFYIPNTLTPKDTYQNYAQTILNTNPVVLDDRGEAIIFGTGFYRQILKDANGVEIWDAVTLSAGGSDSSGIRTVTTNYSVTASDGTILVNAAGGAINITLLDPTTNSGAVYVIKKIDATTNGVTILGTIDSATNYTLSFTNQSVTVQSNGTAYFTE